MVRNEYIKQQGGKCAFCSGDLHGEPNHIMQGIDVEASLFPPNFFSYPVHLHHDHKTGFTIGAVHCKCNAILWQYFRQ